jgi:hypothetical protein
MEDLSLSLIPEGGQESLQESLLGRKGRHRKRVLAKEDTPRVDLPKELQLSFTSQVGQDRPSLLQAGRDSRSAMIVGGE